PKIIPLLARQYLTDRIIKVKPFEQCPKCNIQRILLDSKSKLISEKLHGTMIFLYHQILYDSVDIFLAFQSNMVSTTITKCD
ncbi:hypothetical protein ACJX0J_027232, partial [Zea mays]